MRKKVGKIAATLMVGASTFFVLPATPAAAWMSDCSSTSTGDLHSALCVYGTGFVRAKAVCQGVTGNGQAVIYESFGPWVGRSMISRGDCWRWYLVWETVTAHTYETQG